MKKKLNHEELKDLAERVIGHVICDIGLSHQADKPYFTFSVDAKFGHGYGDELIGYVGIYDLLCGYFQVGSDSVKLSFDPYYWHWSAEVDLP